jgi:hypothetical protein
MTAINPKLNTDESQLAELHSSLQLIGEMIPVIKVDRSFSMHLTAL